MKKILLMAFAVPFMLLASCGDDNDPIKDGTEQGTGEDDSNVKEAKITEPVVEFGKEIEYIKSKDTRTPVSEEDGELTYKDNGGDQMTIYSFNPGLFLVQIRIKDYTYKEAVKFYKKRYEYMGDDGEGQMAGFTDEKKSMVITVGYNEVYKCLTVNYMPYPKQ